MLLSLTDTNSFLKVLLNLSQIPFVCGLRGFVRVCLMPLFARNNWYLLQSQAIFLKKWNNFISQQISSNNCILTNIEFGKGDFTVSVYSRLQINKPNTFEITDITSILCDKITRIKGLIAPCGAFDGLARSNATTCEALKIIFSLLTLSDNDFRRFGHISILFRNQIPRTPLGDTTTSRLRNSFEARYLPSSGCSKDKDNTASNICGNT